MFALLPFVLAAASGYVWWRVWCLIPAGSWLRPVWTAFVVLALAAFFAGMLLSGRMPSWLTASFYRLGSSWLFVTLYLLLILLVCDLLRLLRLIPSLHGSWTAFGVLAGLVAVIFVAGNAIYHCKKRVELPIEASLFRPLKIVAASDLHLGYNIGARELSRWVSLINAERPDAVVFAGDVIDNNVRPLLERDMASILRRIEAPVYAVPGNHEYIAGIAPSLDFLRQAGITVLRDSVAEFGGLLIAGRDDRRNRGRMPLGELLASRAPGQPVLLLDHQPHDLQQAVGQSVTLQISGHTHHGQVWPFNWVTDRIYELAYGPQRRGGTQFYVTSGLGLWGGKFRLGTRSEYVVIFFN